MKVKKFKKLLAISLSSALIIGSSSIYAESEETLYTDEEVETEIGLILDNYFQNREDDFGTSNMLSAEKITFSARSGELSADEMRSELISKLEERIDASIVSADTSYTIKNVRAEDDLTYLDVYEWTFVDYTGKSGLVDTFGYGVDHEMIFQATDTSLDLLSDTYDESKITGMTSSLTQDEFEGIMSVEYDNQGSSGMTSSGVVSPPTINSTVSLRSVSGYNPATAITYANTWVYHNANYVNYEDDYNDNVYGNLNPSGGDCANFVSQCLFNGGISMDSTTNANGWWFKLSNKDSAEAWRLVPTHRDYFAASNTLRNNTTNADDIIPGNPVYYDWDSDGSWNHAAICVGYNSSGVPIVNAHNLDAYHLPWTMSPATTKYSTVLLTTDDVLSARNSNAQRAYNTFPFYGKINNISDVDVFKFVAPLSASYTFYTTNSVNTYGRLYSSSGSLLKYDDNSGTGNNFSMSYTCTAGQTYYIEVSNRNSSTGFYALYIF